MSEQHRISRRQLLRGGVGMAGAVSTGGLLVGCGGGDGATAAGSALEAVRARGYARLAIANEPPYTVIKPNGEVSGAAPEVARAVLARIGIDEVEGVVTPYESMIPGLESDRWDIVTAGLFMNEERCAQVLYSDPVLVSTESFLVNAGNPQGLERIADVKSSGVKVAALSGAFEEQSLLDAGVPSSQIALVQDGRSGVEAVTAGRADAFMLPTLSLNALVEDGPEGVEVTPPIPDVRVTGSGAAFRKAAEDLRAEFNRGLDEIKEGGRFEEILDEWGFDASAAEQVTRKALCEGTARLD